MKLLMFDAELRIEKLSTRNHYKYTEIDCYLNILYLVSVLKIKMRKRGKINYVFDCQMYAKNKVFIILIIN